jgi:uncharacterized protein YjiS (DUF1127 family)
MYRLTWQIVKTIMVTQVQCKTMYRTQPNMTEGLSKMSRYKSPSLSSGSTFGRPKSHDEATSLRLVVTFLFDCLETYRQRKALAALDDHMLKDIGLTRCDVEAEVSRPFWR